MNDMKYLQIKSPVNGTVQRIFLREGNLAVTGKPVLSIEEGGKYEIILKLPPDYPVKKGDPVQIITENSVIRDKVSMVCVSASPEKLKVIKIRLNRKPESVLSNAFVNVKLMKKYSGLIVPVNAIFHMTEGAFVLHQKGNSLTGKKVKVLAVGEEFAVVEGLSEGDVVAVGTEKQNPEPYT
ncbi:MAG: hypothetical protein Q9M89_04595 [Persephonella sp.]|nr:hypothetical protein [Persephonella sp.]